VKVKVTDRFMLRIGVTVKVPVRLPQPAMFCTSN